jgi:hypothetical protein
VSKQSSTRPFVYGLMQLFVDVSFGEMINNNTNNQPMRAICSLHSILYALPKEGLKLELYIDGKHAGLNSENCTNTVICLKTRWIKEGGGCSDSACIVVCIRGVYRINILNSASVRGEGRHEVFTAWSDVSHVLRCSTYILCGKRIRLKNRCVRSLEKNRLPLEGRARAGVLHAAEQTCN